jgi:hypothetical protein
MIASWQRTARWLLLNLKSRSEHKRDVLRCLISCTGYLTRYNILARDQGDVPARGTVLGRTNDLVTGHLTDQLPIDRGIDLPQSWKIGPPKIWVRKEFAMGVDRQGTYALTALTHSLIHALQQRRLRKLTKPLLQKQGSEEI